MDQTNLLALAAFTRQLGREIAGGCREFVRFTRDEIIRNTIDTIRLARWAREYLMVGAFGREPAGASRPPASVVPLGGRAPKRRTISVWTGQEWGVEVALERNQ